MRCPNCGSDDVQFISDVKTKNLSFMWIIFIILTCGVGLIFWLIYIASKNTKTDTKAICKNCAKQWYPQVAGEKKKVSVGGIILLIIIVGAIMGGFYYFSGGLGKNDFDITTLQVKDELVWDEYRYETEIAVYGEITANVNCSEVFLKCEVYSSNNTLVCTVVNIIKISKGQTVSFRLSAYPKNSSYLNNPLQIKNYLTKILR